MPSEAPQIITGMREPHHTGQVTKPMQDLPPVAGIRRLKLNDGEVEFHSIPRSYRVDFQRPKEQLNPATGEIMQEGPRFIQFKDRRAVVTNPTLIHQAKGCKNVPGMNAHEHTKACIKDCEIFACALGHQNPMNPTMRYFLKHPSFGIKGDFWDAADMDAMDAASRKASTIANFKNMAASLPPEELSAVLAAAGVESFALPQREVPKEAAK